MIKLIKNFRSQLLVILLLVSPAMSFAQTSTAPAAGDGTSGNPYQITTLNNLYWLSQTTSEWDKHFIQTADIDASDTENWDSGAGFSPIGTALNMFIGSYNGNGFTISNLYINRPGTTYVGFFGHVEAHIEHVGLINVNITGLDFTGAVVGLMQVASMIEHSFSTGVVNGRNYVGGLVGLMNSSSGNYSSATVNGEQYVGGVVGIFLSDGSLSNSYSTGHVSGQNHVGGLAGNLGTGSDLSNSYSFGLVTGSTNTGGLIGSKENLSTVTNSYWNTETSGMATSAGGTGLTSAELRQQTSFTGWDFTVSGPWKMYETISSPFLKSIPQDPVPGVVSEFTASLAGTAEGWRMFTAPTVNATYQELLSTIWTQGFPGADSEVGTPNVYWYNEADRSWNAPNNITNVVGSGSNSGFINSGRGILVYVFEEHLNNGSLSGWPKELAIENIAPFSNIVVSFSRTITDPDDGMQGWHLVGNPYPFSINWVDMVEDNALVDVMPPIFIYDPNANSGLGGYRVHYGFDIPDLPSEIAHDGIIPPFQAFWSRTTGNSTSGTITFSTKYFSVESGTLYAKQNPNSESKPYLAVYVKGNGMAESAILTFNPENSFITERPITLSAEFIEFGFTDDDNRMYALQNISPEAIMEDKIEIPLVIESTMAGTYTLNAGTLNLPQGIHAAIYDNETGILTDIDEDFEYTFELESRAKSIPSSQALLSAGDLRAKRTDTDTRFSLILSPNVITGNEQLTGLPDRVALNQNYPNPFNPSTIINYELPVNSHVRLEVFDIIGRRVATLADGMATAGTHEVRFDASALSSGVYIYRLTAGSAVFTRKLTVIK